MHAIELRSNAPTTVEDLIHRIAELVLERQSMRTRDEDSALLERNRVDLVRAHQALSQALIERHCPPRAASAHAGRSPAPPPPDDARGTMLSGPVLKHCALRPRTASAAPRPGRTCPPRADEAAA